MMGSYCVAVVVDGASVLVMIYSGNVGFSMPIPITKKIAADPPQ